MLCPGCGSGTGRAPETGDTLYSPRYASRFAVLAAGDGSSVLSVRNPWQGARGVSRQLFLSRGGERPAPGFEGGTVNVPMRRVVCMSSTHVAFIDALGETGTVKGVSGAGYVSNPLVRKAYGDGTVKDVGFDPSVNYEAIASLAPDVVLIYGVAGESSMSGKLSELGIPSVYVGDYLETDPLGKAEWLVAIGELYGKRRVAERIFDGIAGRYNGLKDSVAAAGGPRPTVMLNAPYRDVWFVPGDRSYMATLIRDAGGRYICEGTDDDISRPLGGETAFLYASRADFWLNPNECRSLAELKAKNPKFSSVPAVSERRVYNCTGRSTPEGGCDFWESGALRADVVLEDIVRILNSSDGEAGCYYFERLK